VSSDTSQPGDTFTARLVEPVRVAGDVVIGTGTTVHGNVVEAIPAKKVGGRAKLNLQFTSLTLPSGKQAPIVASFYEQGKSQVKKDAATIGGAAGGGAVLGRIIGHQNDKDTEGTAIGAVVGAAVGTAIAATNQAQQVTIPSGTTIDIQLDTAVKV
jgi:hypothetical protein